MHTLTETALMEYRETVRRRDNAARQRLAARKAQAWEVARRAAALLYQDFDAAQVILFGSLAHGQWFSLTSDIDLAASHISDEHYFVAVAKLQDLSPDFKIDLIQLERCPVKIQEAVSKGILL